MIETTTQDANRERISRHGYSVEDDLGPLRRGDVVLPNFEEMPFEDGIKAIMRRNYLTYCEGHARTIEDDGYPPRAKYFLTWKSMSPSNLDGGGFVLIDNGYAKPPRVGRFAICKHEIVDHAGADHSRGWHPGSCRLCGLVTTSDSGD